MNKHIRAAFFDIDGTLLLFGSHEMPDSTVQALHALQANGVKVFIATGRPPGAPAASARFAKGELGRLCHHERPVLLYGGW